MFEPKDVVVSFLFGVLADRTGIEQDRIGLSRILGQYVTVFAERGDDHLAIENVHLATDGLDVESLGFRAYRLAHRDSLFAFVGCDGNVVDVEFRVGRVAE